MDVTPYMANLRNMASAARAAGEARAAEARRRLPLLTAELVQRFGVRRVVLFGSLLDGSLHEASDIDVAVVGLASERYWEALWRSADIMGRHVDVVPLEVASASLNEHIAEVGEVLHG